MGKHRHAVSFSNKGNIKEFFHPGNSMGRSDASYAIISLLVSFSALR
jgi:hypothetical protein